MDQRKPVQTSTFGVAPKPMADDVTPTHPAPPSKPLPDTRRTAPGRTQPSDLLRSDTATKRGIENTPPTDLEWRRILWLCGLVDDVRDKLVEWSPSVAIAEAWHVTSGYRNHAVNAAAGGSDTSDHLRALAWDEGCGPRVPVDYEAAALHLYENRHKLAVRPQQIIAEPGHVHIGEPDEKEQEYAARNPAKAYETELIFKRFVEGKWEFQHILKGR